MTIIFPSYQYAKKYMEKASKSPKDIGGIKLLSSFAHCKLG
jgi:hypothetical protein